MCGSAGYFISEMQKPGVKIPDDVQKVWIVTLLNNTSM